MPGYAAQRQRAGRSAYVEGEDTPIGLKLARPEWGSYAYGLRRYMFAADVVECIESAGAGDLHKLAEQALYSVEDWEERMMIAYADYLPLDYRFIALRAATYSFVRQYHDNHHAIRTFDTDLSTINDMPEEQLAEYAEPEALIFRALVEEAFGQPEAVNVLEVLACSGNAAAALCLNDALSGSHYSRQVSVPSDVMSIGLFLSQRLRSTDMDEIVQLAIEHNQEPAELLAQLFEFLRSTDPEGPEFLAFIDRFKSTDPE
jgi:hypothetical protein